MSFDPDDGVFVALDHGLHWGVFDGFENPRETLETVLEGNPDGVLGSVPYMRRNREVLDEHPSVTRIATLDVIHDSTIPGRWENAEIHRQAFSLEEAARVGADAVKVCVVYGREDPDVLANNVEFAAKIAERARDHDLTVVLEQVLWGDRIEDDTNPELVEDAARLGVELGADVLKLYYPGQERMSKITDQAQCPVYVAGGPRAKDDTEVLNVIRSAVDAGAAGVMYGRNVWQRDEPSSMIRALREIVHSDVSTADAAVHLD